MKTPLLILTLLTLLSACSDPQVKPAYNPPLDPFSIESVLTPQFKTPIEIATEFREPGHMPQGLAKSPYHPLGEVIPLDVRRKLKEAKLTHRASRSEKALPESSDLRKWDSYVRSQWGGTCTAHGLAAGLESLLARDPSTKMTLSVRHLWSKYRKYSAFAAIDAASTHKLIEEIHWPQDSARPSATRPDRFGKVQLASFKYLEGDVEAATQALAQKKPVYIAMSVPSDMASCRSTIRQSTALTSGGHALLISGFYKNNTVPGGGWFVLKNSWGEDCGDHGYQYMPIAVCARADVYCVFWALDRVQI